MSHEKPGPVSSAVPALGGLATLLGREYRQRHGVDDVSRVAAELASMTDEQLAEHVRALMTDLEGTTSAGGAR